MTEEWRRVVGYEGLYEVSSHGRVKSVERISPQGHRLRERIRKPYIDRYGYPAVNLCKNGIVKNIPVHRLVCTAWHENEDSLPTINHIDGDKKNNAPDNLEWASHSQNIQHAFDTGLKKPSRVKRYGERNPHCKVSTRNIQKIRTLYATGKHTQKGLGAMFGIKQSQVGRIVRNEQRTEGDKEYAI